MPHALAAVYIGVSVAWGSRIVAWADARFAHRFAGGPPPKERASALVGVAVIWTLVLAIDFAISFSYTLWPRRANP